MAVSKNNCLKETLESFFSEEWIREKAREVGYVKRERKVDVVVFFWTILLAFSSGACRRLADLRRAFGQGSGRTISISSFYDRWTFSLTRLLKEAVSLAVETMSESCQGLCGKLSYFKDLVLADATVLRLHDALEKNFPACRTNHTRAAAKLHIVMSVSAASPRSVEITGERTSERKKLKVGPWVKDRLLIGDLGYYDGRLFESVSRNGGYFISRLKENANPLIVRCNLPCRGRSVSLAGKKLQDVLPLLTRSKIDVDVEIAFRKRKYRGERSGARSRYRLVGVMNEETGKYHLYLTNVPGEVLGPEDVARTYRTRWEVELLFKELKTHYRLDQFCSCKREVVESLIYASILTLVVSRGLLMALRNARKIPPSRSPEGRFAAVFQSVSMRLLYLMTIPSCRSGEKQGGGTQKRGGLHEKAWDGLEEFMMHEMVDPNLKRWRNLSILRA